MLMEFALDGSDQQMIDSQPLVAILHILHCIASVEESLLPHEAVHSRHT